MEQPQMGYGNQGAPWPGGMPPANNNDGYAPQDPLFPPKKLASCWARQCARIIDFYMLGFCIVFVLEMGHYLPFVTMVFVEAGVYALFGDTFGKWLSGVRVVDKNGMKLNGSEYFWRNLRFLWRGLYCSIPLLMFIGMIFESNRVSKGLPASYDKSRGISVIECGRTPAKAYASSAVAVGLLLLTILYWVNKLRAAGIL